MDLQIKRVTATPVLVPVIVGETARWVRRTHIDRTIVEIETADGLVGVGEARALWPAKTIMERFRPAILGLSARDFATIRARCLSARSDYGFPERDCDRLAFAAIDLALWDLVGKAESKPLYELLGGAAREQALFCAWGYPPDPQAGYDGKDVPKAIADQAVSAIEVTGSDYFEFKIARFSVDVDIKTVHAVRAVVGDQVEIAVDANMSYDGDNAARFLGETRDLRLANVEEPVRSLAEADILARTFGVPLSTHCIDLDTVRAFPNIASTVPDICVFGGVAELMAYMDAAARAKRGTWLRAMWELGLSWAAMCHVGLASRAVTRPSQSLIDYAEDDLILDDPWLLRNGGVRPPNTPGLGVTLDRAAVERYRAI
ncbi:glucarate dehydratase [Bradyrhizobium sp. USDA 326]|uniref:mandelate racemase/muconate lactonizing enzyme family protein n=1 Tax=Bradyrhizobium sp. USDA 326 TaxID=3377726 RepID=UPI003C77FE72